MGCCGGRPEEATQMKIIEGEKLLRYNKLSADNAFQTFRNSCSASSGQMTSSQFAFAAAKLRINVDDIEKKDSQIAQVYAHYEKEGMYDYKSLTLLALLLTTGAINTKALYVWTLWQENNMMKKEAISDVLNLCYEIS